MTDRLELKPLPPFPEPYWNGNRRAGKPQVRVGAPFNRVIVVHTTEGKAALGQSSHATPDWQNRQKRRASGYHLVVGPDGFTMYGDPAKFRAYHAGRSWNWNNEGTGGGNNHIGMSIQANASDWFGPGRPSAVGKQVLDEAAKCAAYLARQFGVPLIRLSVADYRAGRRGFLGHMDVANKPVGRKSDPGTHFPWTDFLRSAAKYYDLAYNRPKIEDGAVTSPVIRREDEVDKPVRVKVSALTEEDAQFLHEFVVACRKDNVDPGSLAYVVRMVRAYRVATGQANIGAKELGIQLAKGQGK